MRLSITNKHFNVYRVQYLEKSKHLQDQLRDLKTEIEVLKVDEKQCELDMLHDEQVRLGENKYSTLKKVNIFFIKLYIF
jgi:merlin protein